MPPIGWTNCAGTNPLESGCTCRYQFPDFSRGSNPHAARYRHAVLPAGAGTASADVLSVIVAAEFEVKQPVTDLTLKNFRILPFNMPHAVKSAELWRQLDRDEGDSRAVVRDDVKLLAQADKESIPMVFTEDARTLHKYCERLRDRGVFQIRTVLLAEGFDPGALSGDGQRGLNFPTVREESPSYGGD